MTVLYINLIGSNNVLRDINRTKDELQNVLRNLNNAQSNISELIYIDKLSNYRERIINEKSLVQKDIQKINEFSKVYKNFMDNAEKIDKQYAKVISNQGLEYRKETGLIKEEWKKLGKLIIGTLVIAGTIVAAVYIGTPILIGAAVGATVSATIGAGIGYATNGTDGAIDGFFSGSISGALSGAVGGALGGAPPSMANGAKEIIRYMGKMSLIDGVTEGIGGGLVGYYDSGMNGAIKGGITGTLSGVVTGGISGYLSVKLPGKINLVNKITNSKQINKLLNIKLPIGLKYKDVYITNKSLVAVNGININTGSAMKLPAGFQTKSIKDLFKFADSGKAISNISSNVDTNLKIMNKKVELYENNIYRKFLEQIKIHPNREVVNEVIEYVIKKQNSINSDALLNSDILKEILDSVGPNITRRELQNLKWNILNKTIEVNRVRFTPSQMARLWQGGDPYFGLDIYEDIIIKKGDIVYTGYPFPTGYSFTKDTLDSVNLNSKELFQGVQVNPRILQDGSGDYKFQVIGFKMLDDIASAKGITNANPQLGKGGLEQIFTPDFKKFVREGKIQPILDADTVKKLKSIGVEFDPRLLEQVDSEGKYIYKSICEIAEVIADDPNVVKLNNFELTKDEIDEISEAIRTIRLVGGGIN